MRGSLKPQGRSKEAYKKVYAKTKYVRHGVPTPQQCRASRQKVERSVKDFYTATDKQIIEMLKADKFLPELKGATCPKCKRGVLGKMKQWMHHAFAKHAKKPSALVPLPPPTFAGPVLFESAAPKPEDHFEVPVCPPGTPRPEDHFEVPVCPPGRMPSFQLDRSNGASSSSHGASREASSSSGGAREGVAKSGPKAFEKLTRKISAVCIDLESGSSQGSPPPKKVALPGDVDCGEVKLEPIETADEDPFDLLKMGLSDGA